MLFVFARRSAFAYARLAQKRRKHRLCDGAANSISAIAMYFYRAFNIKTNEYACVRACMRVRAREEERYIFNVAQLESRYYG